MVLVDSSVWIGFLRGIEADVSAVEDLVRVRNRASLCGPVLQEVLQGIRSKKERGRVAKFLDRLPFEEALKKDYVRAAEVYAKLRKVGVTVPSVDVLIAVIASRENRAVLTHDRHFSEIKRELELDVFLF